MSACCVRVRMVVAEVVLVLQWRIEKDDEEPSEKCAHETDNVEARPLVELVGKRVQCRRRTAVGVFEPVHTVQSA